MTNSKNIKGEWMIITYDAKKLQVPVGLDIKTLLENYEMALSRIAVFINGQRVPNPKWGQTIYSARDQVEIVSMIAGG